MRYAASLAIATILMWPCALSAEEVASGVLRTPAERFEDLPGYPFAPHYIDLDGVRMHYVDEGPRDAGETLLLLHGEPSWSYLYRHMIPVFVDAGYRVVAPDLIGFGKSDKPTARGAHSYQFHVDSITRLVEKLNLRDITLFCQDWGGLIGLRVAVENDERFKRIVAANTGLPAGAGPDGLIIGAQWTEPDPNAELTFEGGFMGWLRYSQTVPEFRSGAVVQIATVSDLPPDVVAAYDAPFPDESYNAGPRAMPTLVMSQQATNRQAWEKLEQWEKPFLTLFSDGDPITSGGEAAFQERVPGASGQPHAIIRGGGHFLQEDKGEEIAKRVVDFIESTD